MVKLRFSLGAKFATKLAPESLKLAASG